MLIQKKSCYTVQMATLKYITDFHIHLLHTYSKSKSAGKSNRL